MTNLLKEAIADAKAVRELAVKQAKAVLEEAFQPQVNAMISKTLQQEMEDEEEVEDIEDVEENLEENEELEEQQVDTSGIGTGDNKEPSSKSNEEQTDDPEGETDLQGGHEDAKENSGLTEDDHEVAQEDSGLTEEDEFEIGDDEVEGEVEDEDELDLEAIIRELEDETDEEDVNFEDEFEDEEEVAEEEEFEAEPEEDEEEIDIDIEEEDGEEEVDFDIDSEEDDDEELDLEAIFSEEDGEEFEDEEEELEIEALRSENAQLKAKLGETYKAYKYQKKQLSEINMLNAKLLFTNKIFGKFTLDDKSKLKVIENFDRAKNLREVKIVYATIMENINAEERKPVNRAQRLAEGASRPAGRTAKPKEETIIENSEVKSRVHKLMGLKKK